MGEISAAIASVPRDLERMERTLTDGYAKALSLEAEQWRLQKQLGAMAASLDRGDVERKARELAQLARQVERQEALLLRLRELLTRLRSEYGELLEIAAAPARR